MRKNNLVKTIFRFFSYVRFPESGCWEWTGCKNDQGYGVFSDFQRFKDRTYRGFIAAYKWSYIMFVGEVPEGLGLDHLCRNRACVNPAHLEPITQAENILRGVSPSAVNARKTHCNAGHPLSGDNLKLDKHGKRRCAKCQRLYWRVYTRKRRAISEDNYRPYRFKEEQ